MPEAGSALTGLSPSQVDELEEILKDFVAQARETGKLPHELSMPMAGHGSHNEQAMEHERPPTEQQF